ncbi:hypothetical protein [Nonomuraea sp. NPDC049480]
MPNADIAATDDVGDGERYRQALNRWLRDVRAARVDEHARPGE